LTEQSKTQQKKKKKKKKREKTPKQAQTPKRALASLKRSLAWEIQMTNTLIYL
jgi:tRNA(Glu) U13 pseudouridine synthase TruD